VGCSRVRQDRAWKEERRKKKEERRKKKEERRKKKEERIIGGEWNETRSWSVYNGIMAKCDLRSI